MVDCVIHSSSHERKGIYIKIGINKLTIKVYIYMYLRCFDNNIINLSVSG